MITIFQVSSITNAMRGKSLLEGAGIRADITRTMDTTGLNGCGYNLVVQSQSHYAEKVLRSGEIGIRKIIRED